MVIHRRHARHRWMHVNAIAASRVVNFALDPFSLFLFVLLKTGAIISSAEFDMMKRANNL